MLVRAPVCPDVASPSFMALLPGNGPKDFSKQNYTTWRTKIVDVESDCCIVEIDSADGRAEVKRVERKEIVRLNQPHDFPRSDRSASKQHTYVFEDGLRCDYESCLVRAKMCEIALRLDSIAAELDFDAPTDQTLALQTRAVRKIRDCINMNTFQRDADGALHSEENGRSRDRRRYCGEDIGKFAVNGQGHCYTVSSVCAAFLGPWGAALGLTSSIEEASHFTLANPNASQTLRSCTSG